MSDASILRFGTFELHPGSGELRRRGDRVKLPPQPFKVLEALVRRSGEVVTREEIRERVWQGDTFVDFDQGLTRMRDFMVAARTLLEGDAAQSVAAVNRIVASDFRDPEGLFYLARHLSHLEQVTPALELFERVVEGGFFCFPAINNDPWLEPLRKKPSFTKRLRQAETHHRRAAAAFAELQGEKVLGVRA